MTIIITTSVTDKKNIIQMKFRSFVLLALLLSACSIPLIAGDVYAEYKMTGIGNKEIISKMYMKDGNVRSEVRMGAPGKEITHVTLNLVSDPDITIEFNSQAKTYTQVKKNKNDQEANDLTITVIGSEKVGSYNCKHVRMTSKNKSWDMWITKDLPNYNFPLESDEAVNRKMMELLKSKSLDGVTVKVAFLKPGTTTATTTMELVKYEVKSLDASLFKIPEGYTKSVVQFDTEKMKNMTDAEKREMIKKMIEEQKTSH